MAVFRLRHNKHSYIAWQEGEGLLFLNLNAFKAVKTLFSLVFWEIYVFTAFFILDLAI